MAHFAELEEKTDPTGFTSDTHKVVAEEIYFYWNRKHSLYLHIAF